MKYIKIYFLIFIMALVSCQNELEDEFENPEKHNPNPEEIIPGMFTGMVYQWKYYIQDYGEWWWQLGGNGVANYCQISHRYITPRYSWFKDYDDLKNGNGFSDAGVRGRFNDYYTRLKNWGLLRDEIATLSGEELTENQIYFQLATIMKEWGALRNVDLFNSIPYKDAFKGSQGVFFVKYDDPKEIYHMALDNLKDVADKLPDMYSKMSDKAKAIFADSDIALKGNVDKWVQYINAIRLRYAVRLAGVDSDFAKTHIADAIKNLPTEDFIWEIPVKNELPGGGVWWRGLYERPYVTFIPNVIMKRMNHGDNAYDENEDDPRLPVIAMPTKHGDYRGVSMNADAQTADYNAGEKYYAWADDINQSLEKNAKSMYNHATFTHNQFPAYMTSLAEVDLILAEVALKNLASTGKSAGDHINDAVVHSCDFWYGINALSTYERAKTVLYPTKPATISNYASTVSAKFNAAGNVEDKMEVLMQQKYIHLNLVAPYELFADLRRTRHPQLEPMTFEGKVMSPCPERLRYPESEMNNNTEFYMAVREADNFTSPIFWVPQDKKNVKYYKNNYDYN